jgi:hypothetical protein
MLLQPRNCRFGAKITDKLLLKKIIYKYFCNNVAIIWGIHITYQFPGGTAVPPLPPMLLQPQNCHISAKLLINYC